MEKITVYRCSAVPFLFFLTILILTSPLALADEPYTGVESRLVDLLNSGSVLILGEQHHEPSSSKLMSDIVSRHLERGGRLQVALEIAHDQQPAIERALQGNAPGGRVTISMLYGGTIQANDGGVHQTAGFSGEYFHPNQ